MAFIETPRFPEEISFHAQAGPRYMTDVVVTDGGQEQRNQVWSQARLTFDVAHAARLPAAYQTLQAFFRAMNGKTHGFRFRDWSDYQHNDAGGTAVFVALTATTFQMAKSYAAGSQTQIRLIRKPVSPVVVTGGSGASVDYTTGVVTVSSGTPTTWTGVFDVPCRFDTDQLSGEIITRSGASLVMGWNSIPIVEIRT